MSRLSEKKIIELFQNRLGNTNFVPEDVESFKIGKKRLIVKVDTLVESTDLPPGMKLEDTARKSIVSCVSDFATKGVRPIFGIVSLTIPKKFSRSNIESLTKGFQRAAREFELKILGGDTNEGKELVITFSLFGASEKNCKEKRRKNKSCYNYLWTVWIYWSWFRYTTKKIKNVQKSLEQKRKVLCLNQDAD